MSSVIDQIVVRVGPLFASNSAHTQLRAGSGSELVTSLGRGKYAEASAQGQVFFASTAVTGVDPGYELTTTPPFDLHNPVGSGVLVSVLRINVGYISGTLGAGGSIVLAEYPQSTVPSGGSVLTTNSAYLGSNAGRATAGEGRTIAGTPTLIRPSGIIFGPSLASTVGLPANVGLKIDGEITIPEGQALILSGVAGDAGTSPLMLFSVTWQEIPAA